MPNRCLSNLFLFPFLMASKLIDQNFLIFENLIINVKLYFPNIFLNNFSVLVQEDLGQCFLDFLREDMLVLYFLIASFFCSFKHFSGSCLNSLNNFHHIVRAEAFQLITILPIQCWGFVPEVGSCSFCMLNCNFKL